MYILAFETSCDDTSVALMRDDVLIAMSTRTQLEHDMTGWVVPEVAARSHANAIFPCIDDVLRGAGISLDQIDYLACTEKPGLLPSLLTGLTVAKTLSLSLKKPLIFVDHIESHIFANLLERNREDIDFPSVVLTVSGGHTEIYFWKSLFSLECLGQTRDDAAGEAFDKVSKMLWLWFPGWALIASLADEYRNVGGQSIWLFPESLLEADSLDFSFSWLKSAVKRVIDAEIDRSWTLSRDFQKYIAFEFEETVTNILTKKLQRAVKKYEVSSALLAGWVSANTLLKEKISRVFQGSHTVFLSPTRHKYSMDNAAMVGIRAYYEILYLYDAQGESQQWKNW